MKFILNCVSVLMLSSMAFAAPDVSYEGTITQVIARSPSNALNKPYLKASAPKSVTVLKVNLSDKVKKTIQKNASHALSFKSAASKLPSNIQLGMNNVPVLDQGYHGTCATFALTAALDALRGEGDYYSQLCNLSLGQYLANNGYAPGGWDGQYPAGLLARVEEFGLVSKANQREHGCGGMTEYPVNQSFDSGNPTMSPEDFHAISEPGYFSNMSAWSSIFDLMKWISKEIPSDQILEKTKASLYYGNRIVISMLLPIQDDLGLSGQHHVPNDTWLLTGPLEQEIKFFWLEHSSMWGGHAMVITGYDDNAVVVDKDGNTHKGLFTLRNSWGSDIGDSGNFYMSYDYFSTLTIGLDELLKITRS